MVDGGGGTVDVCVAVVEAVVADIGVDVGVMVEVMVVGGRVVVDSEVCREFYFYSFNTASQ